MSSSKVVLCTGANQGLGYGVLEVAGLREPSSVYILGCRTIVGSSCYYSASCADDNLGIWSRSREEVA